MTRSGGANARSTTSTSPNARSATEAALATPRMARAAIHRRRTDSSSATTSANGDSATGPVYATRLRHGAPQPRFGDQDDYHREQDVPPDRLRRLQRDAANARLCPGRGGAGVPDAGPGTRPASADSGSDSRGIDVDGEKAPGGRVRRYAREPRDASRDVSQKHIGRQRSRSGQVADRLPEETARTPDGAASRSSSCSGPTQGSAHDRSPGRTRPGPGLHGRNGPGRAGRRPGPVRRPPDRERFTRAVRVNRT